MRRRRCALPPMSTRLSLCRVRAEGAVLRYTRRPRPASGGEAFGGPPGSVSAGRGRLAAPRRLKFKLQVPLLERRARRHLRPGRPTGRGRRSRECNFTVTATKASHESDPPRVGGAPGARVICGPSVRKTGSRHTLLRLLQRATGPGHKGRAAPASRGACPDLREARRRGRRRAARRRPRPGRGIMPPPTVTSHSGS